MRKALIRGDMVANAVVVDPANAVEWLAVVAREYDQVVDAPEWVSVGCKYVNGAFIADPPAPQPCWILDARVFRFRFTMHEDAAIVAAARIDPEVETLLARLAAMHYIDLRGDPRVATGLAVLVSKNLLSPARRAEIEGTPAAPEEVFRG